MAQLIENPKTYQGQELDTIFFRPMLSGPDAENLGIRILYNMPVPTTLQFWRRATDVLKKYSKGWIGGDPAQKFQKKIELFKVKAELGFSATDYFQMVFEQLSNTAGANMDDLSGTALEAAETSLFKASIAEAIRATMWYGDATREEGLNTFDGFLKRIMADMNEEDSELTTVNMTSMSATDAAEALFKNLWESAPEVLKQFKSDGNLVYLVSSDVYNNYEDSLDSISNESAYLAKQNGRKELFFKGIPVIDVQMSGYAADYADMPASFALLTESRNLALAVNTNDFPGMEVRMWYNPDEMENRQRAVFMAGCDYLLPELIVAALTVPV
ncbi:MAG: hypothetical protein LBM20_04050 [Rikenellaceae bacterium]|jgi:hypothetical protein|nr:hypothetical protein [Rikenellaceae bacterium]